MTELSDLIQSSWITEEDTAFVVVDFQVLADRLSKLNSAFVPDTRHAIAIKTQPMRPVLSWMLERGFCLEAASLEEVQMALECGARPEQLVFDSPVKTLKEIEWCDQHAPGMMVNANSLAELDRMSNHSTLRWGLRVNPGISSAHDPVFDVSGVGSKFGVPLHRREAILTAFREKSLCGLHVHVGSGADAMDRHAQAVLRVLELAQDIEDVRVREGGEPLSFVDVGGGVSPAVSVVEMTRLAQAIQASCRPHWEVWTEFGQWVHFPAGRAYSRVEYVEPAQEKQVTKAFVHLGADYFTRQIYQRRHPLDVEVFDAFGEASERPELPVEIVGPLCFAGDVLTDPMPLSKPEPGDWIRFNHTGANTYGLWSRHCSRSLPKVIGRSEDGSIRILQPRQRIPF